MTIELSINYQLIAKVLRLTKPAKPNKTTLYITDLYSLEILDSPAYSLCL
jgi:hypothetical protein